MITQHTPVDSRCFRDTMGRFASGVTVITTVALGNDCGTTASAVSSLSADPPMLLVCLNTSSSTGAAVRVSGRFAVSVLRADQAAVADRFATKGAAKFAGIDVLRGPSGLPLVAGALAHLECVVVETVTAGTHTIFIGRVTDAGAYAGLPLAYFRGKFTRLATSTALKFRTERVTPVTRNPIEKKGDDTKPAVVTK